MQILLVVLFSYMPVSPTSTKIPLSAKSSYAAVIWDIPAVSLYADLPYAATLTFSRIYSVAGTYDSKLSTYYQFKHFTVNFGIKTEGVRNVYHENTSILYIGKKYKGIGLTAGLRAINISANGLSSVTEPSADLSLSLHNHYFGIYASYQNIARPDLNLVNKDGSSPSRLAFAADITYPENVLFTIGFERMGNYHDARIGYEVWFTKGFSVNMGLSKSIISGGIDLKTGRFGIDFLVKSHNQLGSTYTVSASYF